MDNPKFRSQQKFLVDSVAENIVGTRDNGRDLYEQHVRNMLRHFAIQVIKSKFTEEDFK